MKCKKFIEKNFLIDKEDSGKMVPFILRPVQDKYYNILCRDYDETLNFRNCREMILKARKEGFTSLILAIFAAQLILSKDAIRFLEISYKDESTKQHFRRIKYYIMSFYEKDPLKWNKALERVLFESINENEEFVLMHNKASFYVGTASSKVAERGGNVQGILFSESAHYPNTGIINASEIIEGTKGLVHVDTGMIFEETTANGFNHFKERWDQAEEGELSYKPRFFSWKEFYTQEQYESICAGIADKRKIPQEFPLTSIEAFLTSGDCFFDVLNLKEMYTYAQTFTPMSNGNVLTAVQ